MDGSGTLWGPLLDVLGEAARDADLVRYPTHLGTYDALLGAIEPLRGPTMDEIDCSAPLARDPSRQTR